MKNWKAVGKINETIGIFFAKSKIFKYLTQLTKRQQKQINNIRNERRDITMITVDNKIIVKEYCEQFFPHELDDLDEMGQFLERCI